MNTTVDMPIALTGGVVYLLMALTVVRMLSGIPQACVARLWVTGAGLAGLGLVLVAGRGIVPRFVGMELVAILLIAALLLQSASLRVLLGRPALHRGHLLLALTAIGVGVVLAMLAQRRAMFALGITTLAFYSGHLAWLAWCVSRRQGLGSAAMLAWSQGVLSAVLLGRAISVAVGVAPFQHGQGGFTFLAVHAATVLAALYGSLGFMGMMLDIARRAELQAREGQAAEAARREAAEQAADGLRELLRQREAMSAERERMLQLLAHEIRQPLHNASGALQAASLALGRTTLPAPADQAAPSLRRAESVLGEVRSVLDNTLAAATLLSRTAPLAVQDVDLDFLIDLTLGDLEPAQRQRVQVQWQTDQRQGEFEPGLLRLALRNLLANAFGHGGPAVNVQLQIAEQAQPPALLVRVIDDGPGLPAAPPDGGGRAGLGLDIVRRVMALHGGWLDLLPATPHGLQAVLVLPLPGA